MSCLMRLPGVRKFTLEVNRSSFTICYVPPQFLPLGLPYTHLKFPFWSCAPLGLCIPRVFPPLQPSYDAPRVHLAHPDALYPYMILLCLFLPSERATTQGSDARTWHIVFYAPQLKSATHPQKTERPLLAPSGVVTRLAAPDGAVTSATRPSRAPALCAQSFSPPQPTPNLKQASPKQASLMPLDERDEPCAPCNW